MLVSESFVLSKHVLRLENVDIEFRWTVAGCHQRSQSETADQFCQFTGISVCRCNLPGSSDHSYVGPQLVIIISPVIFGFSQHLTGLLKIFCRCRIILIAPGMMVAETSIISTLSQFGFMPSHTWEHCQGFVKIDFGIVGLMRAQIV